MLPRDEVTMSITKSELTSIVYGQMNMERKKAAEIVDIFFDEIKAGIKNTGVVNISGFGKLVIKQKKARMGRNPINGETMTIAPRKVVAFQHSIVLKKRLNR